MVTYPWQRDILERLLASRASLPHALLLQGRQGIGKADFALALAKTFLCEGASELSSACGHCTACNWFEQGNHPDFRLLESEALSQEKEEAGEGAEGEQRSGGKKPASKIAVAQVRELRDFINLTTHRNGLRIVVIHPAESMNLQAANALLKMLEEPPPRTLFMLVSHQPHQLLATIRSRCQQIDMLMPGKELARAWLQQQNVNDADLCLAQAGNAPLLALSFSSPEYQAQRKGFLQQIADPAKMEPLDLAAKSVKLDLAEVVTWLQKWSCDLLNLRLSGRIFYQLDFESHLRELEKTINLNRLMSFQQQLLATKRHILHPLNPQLLLEELFISYSKINE